MNECLISQTKIASLNIFPAAATVAAAAAVASQLLNLLQVKKIALAAVPRHRRAMLRSRSEYRLVKREAIKSLTGGLDGGEKERFPQFPLGNFVLP